MVNEKSVIELHELICKQMGIKPASIVFPHFSEKLPQALGYYDFSLAFEHNAQIELFVNPILELNIDPLTVMIHETRHHYQHEKKFITKDCYKGIKHTIFENICKEIDKSPYFYHPCEIDAFLYQDDLEKKLGLKPFLSNEIIEDLKKVNELYSSKVLSSI